MLNTLGWSGNGCTVFTLGWVPTATSTAVGRDDDPVAKFIDITDKEARQMLVAVIRSFDW